jgi:uncharacterized membrane-anchored protein
VISVARSAPTTTTGPARVGNRTKELIKRLQPGDIAVIDHADLDRVAAEGLVEAGVAGIINAAPSITGRYPNVGPLLVAAAGIPLIDDVGSDVMVLLGEGATVVLRGGDIEIEGAVVAKGTPQDLQSLDRQVEDAKATIGKELTRFAENTLEYMQAEQYLLLESPTSMSMCAVDMCSSSCAVINSRKTWPRSTATYTI